jgi:hypothetical protein
MTFAFVIGIVALHLAVRALSNAGPNAIALRPFVKSRVSVTVWGQPLPGAAEQLEIDSVLAVGAGLLIRLRAPHDRQPVLLKVAQPGRAIVQGGRVEITAARYIQWAGKRRPIDKTAPALILVVARSEDLFTSTGIP